MMLDPRHLTAVLAISKHGTFARAAAALGVSQPALSKSIALLERRLGVKVFDRGARGSTLTDAGRILTRRAQNLSQLLANAQEEIRLNAQRLAGPLVVGAVPSTMLSLVPDAINDLANAHGGAVVTIVEGLDDHLTPALQRGEIDLLVAPVEGLHAVPADIVETKLIDDPYLIGFRPGHRLAGSRNLRMRDLRDESWVLPVGESSYRRAVEAMFLTAGLPWPEHFIGTNCLPALDRIVAATDRIAIVSGVQVRGANSSLATASLADIATRAIGVKQRVGMSLPPLATDFLERLKHVAATTAQ
jgi:DNA-binding transcriptional LysR family regulator